MTWDHAHRTALVLAAVVLVLPCSSATAATGAWEVVQTARHSPPLVFTSAAAVPGTNVVWIAGAEYLTAPVVFERWSAGRWTAFPAPTSPQRVEVAGMGAAGPGDVWAVGSWRSATGSPQPFAEHWNGRRWSVSPVPSPGSGGRLADVSAGASDDVWAVGAAGTAPLVEHWDGLRWRIVSSPRLPASARLDGVTTVPRSATVWAVGVRPVQPAGAYGTLVERWSGHRWHLVSSPNYANGVSGPSSGLAGVAALGDGNVWAVGGGSTTTGDRLLVEHWDGDRWAILPHQPDAGATDIARVPGTHGIWVVGSRASGAETNETFTERIGPAGWRIVASPNPDQGCEHSNQFTAVAATANGTVWAAGYHYHLSSGCGDAVTGPLVARHPG
jgi:hypothetical protein